MLDGIDDIDKARALKNKVLYMKRSDAKIPAGSYFIAELVDCKVIDADDEEKCYGILSDAQSDR